MVLLREHWREPADCAAVHQQYVPGEWQPAVFTWAYSTRIRHIDRVFEDPEYGSVYAKAGHLAPLYGPPQQLLFPRRGHRWSKKRMQNLNHIRVLRLAVPGLELHDLAQVVEFGGGSGDLAAAFRDMGFRGTHLVVDLPAMNLLQFYWHRYSGLPSLLGSTLPCHSEAARDNVVLESSADTTRLRCHIDPSLSGSSLFFATWSFTEADIMTRDLTLPLVENFGTIYLVFYSDFDGNDNDRYLQKKVLDAGLEETHEVISWKVLFGGGFYLVARRRDLSPARCAAEVNCRWYTMHHSLPRGGLRAYLAGRIALLALALCLGVNCLGLRRGAALLRAGSTLKTT